MCPTKLSATYEGSCHVLIMHADSTDTIQRGGYWEKISVTRIAPYFNKNSSTSTTKIKYQLLFIIGKVFYYGIAKILVAIETAVF